MRVLMKPGVLDGVQKKLNMTDKEFATHIGVSRSQLWRAKLQPDDKRFSLGQDFIAKTCLSLNKQFDDVFFLDSSSHVCYSGESVSKEVV